MHYTIVVRTPSVWWWCPSFWGPAD